MLGPSIASMGSANARTTPQQAWKDRLEIENAHMPSDISDVRYSLTVQ
jgi:hypothetical protein